jgi:hypothetical protein
MPERKRRNISPARILSIPPAARSSSNSLNPRDFLFRESWHSSFAPPATIEVAKKHKTGGAPRHQEKLHQNCDIPGQLKPGQPLAYVT